jgi:hypothetical protein
LELAWIDAYLPPIAWRRRPKANARATNESFKGHDGEVSSAGLAEANEAKLRGNGPALSGNGTEWQSEAEASSGSASAEYER